MIETVCGPLDPAGLGWTLTHEHLFIGWPGWDLDPLAPNVMVDQYADLCRRLALARDAGVATIVDATPGDLGRDVQFLRRAALETGLNVIASTGFYHESWSLPVYLKMRTVEELTAIFVHELSIGVDGTDIRAGAIKVASAGERVGKHERKVLEAAGRASNATGRPILTHASSAPVALEQASVLLAAGAIPARIQLGHCDSFALVEIEQLLSLGVFVAFDQVVYEQKIDLAGRVESLATLTQRGWARQITLSHDQLGIVGGRQVPLTSTTRGFDYLPRTFVPELARRGMTPEDIRCMTITNPARWLGGETT